MRGDHVYVRRRHYSHHGIDCGDGTIIHFARVRRAVRRVERTSWEAFAAGGRVQVRRYRWRLPVEVIIRNAESRLGAERYHLVRNNCEHLATWSSTGSAMSNQVRRWLVVAPGAVASAGLIVAANVTLLVIGTVGIGLYFAARPRLR